MVTAWPEFHHGVAAGLRLAWGPSDASSADGAPSAGRTARARGSGGNSGDVTDGWVLYERPDEPTYAHAGMLMAFGLTGHLQRLSWTDLYR